MLLENVSAISTAIGVGGVAIIRISGRTPLDVAEKMFKPTGKISVKDFEPYKLYTGEIDCGEFTDFGMCVYFKAPKSYTGEEMVEFHCHGGTAITRGVLKRTFDLGCRPATRGEFTKRAFMNGQLALTQAEAVIDLIAGGKVNVLDMVSAVYPMEQAAEAFKALAENDGSLSKVLIEL